MKHITRRRFLEGSAAALSIAANGKAQSAKKDATLWGVQLYTVRSVLPNDPAATLAALDRIGYREAEVIWNSIDVVAPLIVKTHLKPVSVHLDSALFKPENSSRLSAAIARCRDIGFEYAVYPYVPPAERTGGPEMFKVLAGTLNRAGAECHKAGLKLCYHNHAFEFQPINSTTGMDILLSNIDPSLVGWEMDIFWVSVGGHDPAQMLKKSSGRVPLLHLKNKAQGMAVQYTESVPRSSFKEVGDGVLDIPAILQAAKAAGVKHFFVEQDQTPGDPIESLRQSYEYLQN